jgi:protein-S-isoprenylcysteine O-methyltransferase Ste14
MRRCVDQFHGDTWPGIGLTFTASIFLIATAKVEEAEDLCKFGGEYRRYMRTTRMFIPYVL